MADLAAAVATAVFWCLQEWLIHDKLLHSPSTWFGETVHRWHHVRGAGLTRRPSMAFDGLRSPSIAFDGLQLP